MRYKIRNEDFLLFLGKYNVIDLIKVYQNMWETNARKLRILPYTYISNTDVILSV